MEVCIIFVLIHTYIYIYIYISYAHEIAPCEMLYTGKCGPDLKSVWVSTQQRISDSPNECFLFPIFAYVACLMLGFLVA